MKKIVKGSDVFSQVLEDIVRLIHGGDGNGQHRVQECQPREGNTLGIGAKLCIVNLECWVMEDMEELEEVSSEGSARYLPGKHSRSQTPSCKDL